MAESCSESRGLKFPANTFMSWNWHEPILQDVTAGPFAWKLQTFRTLPLEGRLFWFAAIKMNQQRWLFLQKIEKCTVIEEFSCHLAARSLNSKWICVSGLFSKIFESTGVRSASFISQISCFLLVNSNLLHKNWNLLVKHLKSNEIFIPSPESN